MVWKMTCRTLPKANPVRTEIYQVHTNIGIFTNVIFDDTGALMCWTSASGIWNVLFEARSLLLLLLETSCVWLFSDKTTLRIRNAAVYQSKFRSKYPEPCQHLILNFKHLATCKSLLSQPSRKSLFCFEANADSLLFHTSVPSIFGSVLPKFGHSHL